MHVPMDDLELQQAGIMDDLIQAAEEVFRSGKYVLTQGHEVKDFEQDFSQYIGSRFTVGLSSGTAALHLALVASGIGPGDEVLVPANTYIATVFAISYTGARPVLVDIDAETFTLDVNRAAEHISPKTRAIMPVHLYGQPADMDAVVSLAHKHDLVIIEDAAQAHGARYHNRRVGTFGHASAFSFYPTKNLGALGDAGAAVTSDEEIAARIRQLRYMGQRVKYSHEVVGYQERMDEIQGALLRVKLRHLDTWNDQRREQAAWYGELLADVPVTVPKEAPERYHVYHLYVIRAPKRDALKSWLTERDVATGIFYPTPVHLNGAYADLGYGRGDFPETERASEETLALPLFPGYSRDTIEYVADQVREFYRSGVASRDVA